MSTQHTPGPWHVSSRNRLAVIESGPRGNHIAKMGANLGVCSQEQAEANARLIAAAPDLLAVLKELQESAAYWSEYDVPLGIVDRINAAIAKAEEA